MTRKISDYNLQSDELIYSVTDNPIPGIISISACTIAGSKDGKSTRPNEDSFSIALFDSNISACVFDGNSSMKPIKSLGSLTGARYASHFLCRVFNTIIESENIPNDIMHSLNAILLASVLQFEGADIRDTHTLPATAVTIVKVDPNTDSLTFSHIGDTFCILFYDNDEAKIITADKIKPFDEETYKAIKNIAKEKNIPPREAKKDQKITDMIIRRYTEQDNRSDGTGYGELNGQPNAERYMQSGILSLSNVKSILIGSDGFIPPGWDIEKKEDQIRYMEILESGGLQELIKIKKTLEDNDPNFEKFIRYKHSDDATAIYIKLKP